MSLEVFFISVPEEVLDLGGELQEPMDEALDAAAHYLADLYRRYTSLVGAVSSGTHLFSIHVEEGGDMGGERHKQVVADSGYSAVIEYGWLNRGQGQLSYPGRFPAKQAIEFYVDTKMGDFLHSELFKKYGHL